MPNTRRLAVLLIAAMLTACGGNDTGQNVRDTMTRRQRDSVLGQSGLPGAAGVTKTLTAADSIKARQAQLDSVDRP